MKGFLGIFVCLACLAGSLLFSAFAGTDPIDISGTITLGGTSQQILAGVNTGLAPRKLLIIQNREATDHLYVNFGAAASASAATSIDLAPGAVMWFDVYVPGDSVNILGPTTGDKFTCKYR